MKKLLAACTAVILALAGVGVTATAANATVEECVPFAGSDAWDETISDAWDEVVVDVAEHWQRYSAKGSWKEDYAPPFPSDSWVANVQGDPHGIGAAGPYSVSNEESGNVDFFYLEWVPAVTHPVHHDAVIVHHDAVPPVVCDDEPETVKQVALYCYDKLDPSQPAGWSNSGEQTLAAVKDGDEDWTEAEKRELCGAPVEACEPGSIASQTDWVNAPEDFVFPEHITYPNDNIGWPPIYNAVHTDLVQTEPEGGCQEDPPICAVEDVPVWHVWTGGPILGDDGPAADDEGWNPNSGNPQSENHAYEGHTAGVPYFVSHGNSGNGDWFLWTLEDCPPPPTPTVAYVDWDATELCIDRDGSGFLTVINAQLTGAYWNEENYLDIPGTSLADFHPGAYGATSEGHFVLTYEADDGSEFEGGDTTFVLEFWVNHATDDECIVGFPTQFNADPTAPSCLADGALPNLAGEFPNVTITVNREYDGPGVYTITVTPNGELVLVDVPASWTLNEDGSASRVITVAGKLLPQSTDAAAPCYNAPPPPPGTPGSMPITGTDSLAPFIGAGGALLLGLLLAVGGGVYRRRFS